MENKNFIVYDYMTKEINKDKESMLRDCYESFGWELVSKETTYFSTTVLNFRRNRELKKNPEIKVLQRKMEKLLEEVDNFEKQKTSSGLIISLIVGIVGALILGGGMSLVMFNETNIPLLTVGIILGAIGIIICGLNLPLFKNIVRKKTAEVSVIIEEKYDELSNILIEANKILIGD